MSGKRYFAGKREGNGVGKKWETGVRFQVSGDWGHGAWRMGHGVEILKRISGHHVSTLCALRYAQCHFRFNP
jgi:hypothetical protein